MSSGKIMKHDPISPSTLHEAGPPLPPAQCSVASFKADLTALKEHVSKMPRYYKPDFDDLQKLTVIVDKLTVVVERLEHQLPPNDAGQRAPT